MNKSFLLFMCIFITLSSYVGAESNCPVRPFSSARFELEECKVSGDEESADTVSSEGADSSKK